MKKLNLLSVAAAAAMPLVAIAHPGHDGVSSDGVLGASILHYLFSSEHLPTAVGFGSLIVAVAIFRLWRGQHGTNRES